MARYTGSTSKVARKFGEPIYGPDSSLQKKNYAPGQHGPSKRRGKKTDLTDLRDRAIPTAAKGQLSTAQINRL